MPHNIAILRKSVGKNDLRHAYGTQRGALFINTCTKSIEEGTERARGPDVSAELSVDKKN
jgi:hypothetical protein